MNKDKINRLQKKINNGEPFISLSNDEVDYLDKSTLTKSILKYPNQPSEEDLLDENKEDTGKRGRWRKIKRCEYCNKEFNGPDYSKHKKTKGHLRLVAISKKVIDLLMK